MYQFKVNWWGCRFYHKYQTHHNSLPALEYVGGAIYWWHTGSVKEMGTR